MSTTVTGKGQVTIPKPLRDRLGITPGSAVTFELELDGRVVLRKIDGVHPANRFESLRGRAGSGNRRDHGTIWSR